MLFECIHNLTGPHSVRVTNLNFSATQPLLATADDNGVLAIWEVQSGVVRHVLAFDEAITAVAWDHARKDQLFVGLVLGVIRLVDSFQVRLFLRVVISVHAYTYVLP